MENEQLKSQISGVIIFPFFFFLPNLLKKAKKKELSNLINYNYIYIYLFYDK